MIEFRGFVVEKGLASGPILLPLLLLPIGKSFLACGDLNSALVVGSDTICLYPFFLHPLPQMGLGEFGLFMGDRCLHISELVALLLEGVQQFPGILLACPPSSFYLYIYISSIHFLSIETPSNMIKRKP